MQDAKAAARKAARARRKAAHEAAERDAGTDALFDVLRSHAGQVVAGYWPIHSEIDPRPAMTRLAALGSPLALPVVVGAAQPLIFRPWSPGAPMIPGDFGAAIPDTEATMRPEVIIVPMLAFDGALLRLGYGGGFYDRTLAALRRDHAVRAIGFAYRDQQAPGRLPAEPTDQPLDLIVTEAGILPAATD